MTRARWIAAALGGSLILAALAWCATAVATGRRIEAGLNDELHAPERPAGLQLLELDHKPGWFSSSGSAMVRIALGCGAQNRARAPLFHLDYRFEHWPSWQGPVRLEARAQPLSAFGEDLRSVAGQEHVVEAHGGQDYRGVGRIQLQVPARTLRKPRGTLELAEAQGQIVVDGEALEIEFRQPRLFVETRGWQAEARDLTLAWKLRDRSKAIGSTQTSAAAVSSSFGAAEGVKISTRGAELNGRVELHLSAQAARLVASGKTLYDAKLQADASGLHAESFAQLTQSARDNCSVVAVAIDPSNKLREGARGLLQHGLSLAVSKLAARSDDGSLAGDLELEMRPTQGAIAIATQLRSLGQLTLLGASLTSAGQQNFSLRPFLKPIPGGVRASYAFDNGALTINDKAWSPFLVRVALNLFDSALLAL
jgi:hypothetical protein